MLSNRYESTEVDRKPWLYVSSGTHLSTSNDTHQEVEIKKKILLRRLHRFKSELINNMDNMRISGMEPSSVILSQIKQFKKLKRYAKKCQNKIKPKGVV